jgi:RNA polymerase-binding transcription factor DksA
MAVGGEIDRADEDEVAEGIDEYENNSAILKQLETRLNEVSIALDQIEKGTYGTCKICGAEIETERLNANPAAQTCKLHMNE